MENISLKIGLQAFFKKCRPSVTTHYFKIKIKVFSILQSFSNNFNRNWLNSLFLSTQILHFRLHHNTSHISNCIFPNSLFSRPSKKAGSRLSSNLIHYPHQYPFTKSNYLEHFSGMSLIIRTCKKFI